MAEQQYVLVWPRRAHTERLGVVRVEREMIHDTLARALIDTGEPDRPGPVVHHRINTATTTTTTNTTSSSPT
jgi:hypothetical protein